VTPVVSSVVAGTEGRVRGKKEKRQNLVKKQKDEKVGSFRINE
jgi:hypothetical protein